MADSVLTERDQVARYRLRLVAQQLAAAKAAATASGQLASAQVEVTQLTQQLADAPRRPAEPAPTASGPGAGAATPAAGIPFPLPSGSVAPPATWSLGDGVNIAAPAGTPELAVCTGTIVLHGIGGLGSSTPVLRCDRPLAGYSYVYYGFAGPKLWRRSAPTSTGVSRSRGWATARSVPRRVPTWRSASRTPAAPRSARQPPATC